VRGIETDYLVVGAGAAGMAFVDALVAACDADVVMVFWPTRSTGTWWCRDRLSCPPGADADRAGGHHPRITPDR
jgi:cation diffusion facilitator CzcD-associated flavoprotein CzcO